MLARHWRVSIGAIIIVFTIPGAALPQELRQERLFALVPEYPGAVTRKFIELDTRAETFGEVLATWPGVAPAVRFDGPLYALAGGRYVVWTDGVTVPGFPVSPVRLNVFDTLLGSIHVIDDALYGAIVAVDTHRPRVFLAEPQRIAVVDARSGTISYIPRSPSDSPFQTGAPAAYAGDADRLFVRRINDWTLVDVFDVASRTLVQTISVGNSFADGAFALATNPAGTRLYVLVGSQAVSVYDTATSALIARVGLAREDTQSSFTLHLDEQRRRLLVGALAAFDADTMVRLGGVQGVCTGEPDFCSGAPAFTLVGPRSPLLFFTSRRYVDFERRTGGCAFAPLERRDPETGRLQQLADLARLVSGDFSNPFCFVQMAMTTVPPAPRSLSSEVRGQQVTLTWVDPGNATHFHVEVGSAPGLRNLFEQTIGGTTLAVDNVPPGTYFVRLRAINDVGRSLPVDIAVYVQ